MQLLETYVKFFKYIPHVSTLLREGGHLQLYPVHPVDAVDEQNEDEDKCDLKYTLLSGIRKTYC